MIRFFSLLIFLTFSFGSFAEDVAADLTEDFIPVSIGFDGAKVTVFGTMKRRSDVAIVLEGPRVSAKIREKKREMGVWVNGNAVEILSVPGFFAVKSSRPFPATKSKKQEALNIDALVEIEGKDRKEDVRKFSEIRKSQNLFQEDFQGVEILSDNMFRADFSIPSSAPIGEYMAKIYLLRNGIAFASSSVPLKIAQVGVEAEICNLARLRPFVYAFLAIALSVIVGGGAAMAFRKSA